MGLENSELKNIENDFGITLRHCKTGFQIEGNEKKRKLIRQRLDELKEVKISLKYFCTFFFFTFTSQTFSSLSFFLLR